ncbi:MAG TPA: type I-A CRISPR-associated protein Cas4/Csa1 [Chloroflexota bacterium]|nr:type I-A CRISPR-associated protein Cas4/Csa1 [Chloroflexota bacterium]
MYFLNEDERRFLRRRLLPEARQRQVHPTLRGWHWASVDAPARPTYGAELGVVEVADGYCRSGRDVYVRRVLGQPVRPTREIQEVAALHAFAAAWVTRAKALMYAIQPALLMHRLPDLLTDAVLPLPSDPEVARKAEAIRQFETYRLLALVQETLARQPEIGPDALVASVLPVTVEQRLDGRFLGLSPHLAVDALLFNGPIVLELKFGPRREFHRLATTGYALALESVHEMPVDLGCVVYVDFRQNGLAIERDFHFIDDELRTRFIEARDEKQRLVEEEIDPGLPDQCYDRCPHLRFCGTPAQQRAAASSRGAAGISSARLATPPQRRALSSADQGRARAPQRPASANLPDDQPDPSAQDDYVPPSLPAAGA